jgi:hypothetical protein
MKFRERRQKAKAVRNPVTGLEFTKAERKIFRKHGVDDEGHLRSKYDTSNKQNRLARTASREVVRLERSRNGNTFGESIGKVVGSIFGGGNKAEQQAEADYMEYENEPVYLPQYTADNYAPTFEDNDEEEEY